MKVFVTGSSGFVGHELLQYLGHNDILVQAGVRTKTEHSSRLSSQNIEFVETGDLSEITDFEFLNGCDAVVHLAGRAHVMNDTSENPKGEYERINTLATEKLARAAKLKKIKKFIFISTIKVNGESTVDGSPFFADAQPAPTDFYAISKLNAELSLLKMHQADVFDVVVIRPPLIYGDNPKGNLKTLSKIIDLGLPLPFGNITNKRSLVHVLNLCDLILTCLKHPSAAGQIFLVADSAPYSLTTLIRHMADLRKRAVRLFPFPQVWMMTILKWLGLNSLVDRLFGNLEVSIEKNKSLLGWRAPYSFDGTKSNP